VSERSDKSSGPDVRVLPVDRWAAVVTDAWVERLSARPSLRMCLPTGSTPLPVYAEMRSRQVSWAAAEVLLLDEWVGLPPSEPGGCDATLRRELLDRVDLPPDRYRPIHADAPDLSAECGAVDAWLDGGLDLAILGVGVNGHLGMNEPGTPAENRTHLATLAASTIDSAAAYFGDRPRPAHGVTVGLTDLLAAREVWVLATGARKAEIVRESLHGEARPAVPASLLSGHPNCVWWLDEAAAVSGLPRH